MVGPAASKPVPSQALMTLNAHEGGCNSVKWNSDGSYCMSGGVDKLCKLWNPNNGRLIKVYKGHSYPVSDICVSSDNNFFASAGLEKAIFVWDVTKDVPSRKLRGHTEQINCVTFGAEDSILASGSYDGTLKLWDMKAARTVTPIMTLSSFQDSVTCIHISGNQIATGCVDGYVRTFDVRMGKVLLDCILKPIVNVRVSSDRNCLVVQTLDSTIRLLDRKSGELLNEYKGHANEKYRVGSCLSCHDEWLVTGSEDAGIYIYDVVTAQVAAKLEGHRGCVTSVQYHPKVASFLSTATDGTIRLWGAPVGPEPKS
uniref:Guanine nucleotide-binding protein subunit beta-like protein n=1 Tax=Eutreptiella gymnastica TaxID=73025 RepID=A0A7S1N1X4_9EUGL|mmetsp:Transcript_105204/g.181390  ORF Transcript_105204/g.181390 Transcript_105204/m.181390 type:complete len:313 (+) Transcript_105204:25-963(+)